MIVVVTSTDSELLALRVAVEALPAGFEPVRGATTWTFDVEAPLTDVRCVVVRLLGGRRGWDGLDRLRARCRDHAVPLVAVSGEDAPDAELTALSTVPGAIVEQTFAYLAHGGPRNVAHALRFVADTVLVEGFGFDPPEPIPDHGVWRAAAGDGRPVVGIVFYRAHLVAGNTLFVDDLCAAVTAAGGDPVAVWCYSLRGPAAAPTVAALAAAGVDVVVTTVLAAGGRGPGAGVVGAPGGPEGEEWDASALAALDVAVVQAPSSGWSRARWEASSVGLGPYDVAAGIAIPELDGRIIAPTFAFAEVVDDGDVLGTPVRAYRTVPDRCARVAGIALRHARLRRTPPAERRVALVLSAYPTRRSRLGNAVGLDTPASALRLLAALADEGYVVGDVPPDGDELMARLADGLTDDAETCTPAQAAMAVGTLDGDRYRAWFAGLPAPARAEIEAAWGPAPGIHRVHDGALVFSGLDLGHVLIAVQPPRGHGDDPVAVYHSPTLPPTHHHLGFYRWLDDVWGADAIVHLGKHGTLEWLPGKPVALTAGCGPDLALGAVPLLYPFVVNDPGEAAQAKRRAHAVVVDHLIPPMARAEAYDELARLEALLDELAQVQALDPTKVPALRAEIWDVVTAAAIDRDLGLAAAPDDDAFDDVVVDLDGYLCTLKDAQIRGGLHVLGQPPEGAALVDLVLAVTRLPQGPVPSLRATVAAGLGLDLDEPRHLDAVEAGARGHVEAAAARGWREAPDDPPAVRWACTSLVPRLRRTGDEITHLLAGLAGRPVPAGPSGSPTRGGAHVLPTGRNLYGLDPRALPSRRAWDVGVALADGLVARHLDETGRHPETVGLVLWGTAATRTQGDDVAEVLALLGVRPVWEDESRRVTGVEVIPLDELGRPRVDVTVRISGFFRDAFPDLVHLLDDAVALVAGRDEPPDRNPVRAHGADPRVFGPPPGAYGVGVLALVERGTWRGDADLAAAYADWTGFAYGRDGYGVADAPAMRRRFAAIEVAVKNQDTRKHDIFDSAEYPQEHGGMVAAVRALAGREPRAWLGDSSDPSRPRVRSLAEEAARVVRTRVVNPRWIGAMQRHGYRGAAEMAATVDVLFGYDATAHVVDDWMYERVAAAYVADPAVRRFYEEANPWALGHIAERLLEAVEREMWAADAATVALLRRSVLEAEAWEEGR